MFQIGELVKIKDSAWSKFLYWQGYNELGKQKPNHFIIRDKTVRGFSVENIYGYWFQEEELIKIENWNSPIYIRKNSRRYSVGDRLRCTCVYEVTKLYPVYDQEGKYIEDHVSNSFHTTRRAKCDCPIHSRNNNARN